MALVVSVLCVGSTGLAQHATASPQKTLADKIPAEPPPPTAPPDAPPEETPPLPPWTGQIGVDEEHRGFVDDAGTWILPLFAQFGEAFAAYVRRPAEVEEQLATIKAAGYDGIRFWDNLGYYPEWRGREISPFGFYDSEDEWVPRTSDYYAKLRDFLMLLEQQGLAVHHSRGDLNTVSLNQVIEHSRRVKHIYEDIGLDTVALYEGNNEDWQNGDLRPDGLRLVVAPFQRAGVLTALSHRSEEPDDIEEYSTDTLFYVHGSRGGTATDRIRHVFSVNYERLADVPRLGWQGEPVGPGSSAGSTRDVEELGLLAAMSLIARQAWTYMSGYGAFWNGPLEEQPGFHVIPLVRAFLREHTPDLMTFQTLVHGGRENAVLVPADPFFDPERGITHGLARLDQAIADDGRVVAVAYGGDERPKRILNRTARSYLIHVAAPHSDGLDVRTLWVHPGQAFEIEYRVGRIIVGLPQ